MLMIRRFVAVAAAFVAVSASVGVCGPAGAATPAARPRVGAVVCPPAGVGRARCFTVLEHGPARGSGRGADDGSTPDPQNIDGSAPDPQSIGADDLRQAYAVPAIGGHATVAVSIWSVAPNLEKDLNIYRARYGLGPCTTASGCLRIVNQRGRAKPLPAADPGVDIETTLDVSMISAACPSCRLLVVEADSNEFSDLAVTEGTAKRLGATVISNSYGGLEQGGSVIYRSAYEQPGVVTVASSGDAGYADTSVPAAFPDVVAVGGTTLTPAPNTTRGWTEQAWLYGSSGCSAYFDKPAWQHDTICPNRAIADLSAAADEIALYYSPAGGWISVGGTSASAPFVAGLFGLAGNATSVRPGDVYRHASDFRDITTGTNDRLEQGAACGHTYLCVAKKGYDEPTGLGSPQGIAGL